MNKIKQDFYLSTVKLIEVSKAIDEYKETLQFHKGTSKIANCIRTIEEEIASLIRENTEYFLK